ncbi:hypothetical protein LTR74_001055 [Friedmanniomyces endolithicus]|nr:hypothetical protein LTR74_001055 [Friedmanniomyces endolithicus]
MFATHGDVQGYNNYYPPDPNLNYSNCGFFVFTPSGAHSFHAKYWDGDLSHDPVLKAIWKE